MATIKENIKVVIKARPISSQERMAKMPICWRIQGDTIERIKPPRTTYVFGKCNAKQLVQSDSIWRPVTSSLLVHWFTDQIFDEDSSTQDLYEAVAQPIVQSSVNGFNGTIFAYGQTSSGTFKCILFLFSCAFSVQISLTLTVYFIGKTHTMLGNATAPGVMVLAARDIFKKIEEMRESTFLVK